MKICRECKRCNEKFYYGEIFANLRGRMTRRYCDNCIILQHRDESREYQRKRRAHLL
jgi:hypothetical protein